MSRSLIGRCRYPAPGNFVPENVCSRVCTQSKTSNAQAGNCVRHPRIVRSCYDCARSRSPALHLRMAGVGSRQRPERTSSCTAQCWPRCCPRTQRHSETDHRNARARGGGRVGEGVFMFYTLWSLDHETRVLRGTELCFHQSDFRWPIAYSYVAKCASKCFTHALYLTPRLFREGGGRWGVGRNSTKKCTNK